MKKLLLAWQDPKSRYWFVIGQLTFDGENYHFLYTKGIKEAQKMPDFQLLHSFPKIDQPYISPEIFPLFSNRLMRPSRPDYQDYIQWLNIPQNENDPITILARSGGQKATDTFEVFPYPEPDENRLYHLHFFVHGLRYMPECSLEKVKQLKQGDILYLTHDLQNTYDKNALLLRTKEQHNLGYCPRYLAEGTIKILQQDSQLVSLVSVCVERVNPAPTPIQLRLLCSLTAKWDDDYNPFFNQDYQPIRDFS